MRTVHLYRLALAALSLTAAMVCMAADPAKPVPQAWHETKTAVREDAKAIGTAVKRDTKVVVTAVKRGAHEVAVVSKQAAHEVAVAARQGAAKVKSTFTADDFH